MKTILKIGIDGRCLSGQLTGIGRYVYELIKELDGLIPEAIFFVYSPKELSVELPSDRWIIRTDEAHNVVSNFLSGYMWLKFRCGALIVEDDIDVFWANRTLVPNLPVGVKTILTVHDFNHILQPSTMPLMNYIAHKIWFDRDVSKADKVITNSKGTADRLYQLLKRKADGYACPSFSSKFHVSCEQDKKNVCVKYSIEGSFLLSVATQEPRKNLYNLIEAFLLLKKNYSYSSLKLILVGPKGWKSKKLKALMQQPEAIDIRVLGYVPNEDLPSLYGAAELFVFPSLYEGFGMPVLEARACGTRVVTTDTPELREAGGENSIYVGTDASSIVDGILKGLVAGKVNKNELDLQPSWRRSAEVIRGAIIS